MDIQQAERIDSVKNPRIKAAAKLLVSAKERKAQKRFLLEGLRLCSDVVRSALRAEELYVTEEEFKRNKEALTALAEVSDQVFFISNAVAEKLSDTVAPQGVYCVLPVLDRTEEDTTMKQITADGCYLFLENVQDPANLGAICRTAEALGMTGLLVSGGCDKYNPKALRASMGALLRMKVLPVSAAATVLEQAQKAGMKTYASTPDSNATALSDVQFGKGSICVIGNEANGVTEDTMRVCGERITIPMAGRAESLNAGAAASILMWEMVKPYEKTELLDLAFPRAE